MSPSKTIALVLATVACVAGGCSSDDDGEGTGGSGATTGSGAGASASTGAGVGGDPTPEESCVKPGDQGNNLGVGEYCTPAGGECAAFPEAGLCLASVGQDQWFCTQISCDETTDCGEDAGCLIQPGEGSACVPCRCSDQSAQCGGGTGGGGVGGAGGSGGGAGGK